MNKTFYSCMIAERDRRQDEILYRTVKTRGIEYQRAVGPSTLSRQSHCIMMGARVGVLCVVTAGCAAHSNYVGMIPNGARVTHGVRITAYGVESKPWHAVGHVLPEPPSKPSSFERNSFGKAFVRAGRFWSHELCMEDSDGDGLTNGEELGDPACEWHVGLQPARTQNISHPGIHSAWLIDDSGGRIGATRPDRPEPIISEGAPYGPSSEWPYGIPLTPPVIVPYVVQPLMICLAVVIYRRCAWIPRLRWRLLVCLTLWLYIVGMSMGYHRYFSHKAFTTGVVGKNILGFSAGMALQGTVKLWAMEHRQHHKFCDAEYDFHSPVTTQSNASGYSSHGFWHAHALWPITAKKHASLWCLSCGDDNRVPNVVNQEIFIPDLVADDELYFSSAWDNGQMLLIAFAACLLAALFTVPPPGVPEKALLLRWRRVSLLTVFYWGSYVSVPQAISWHSTMCVNSINHMWGSRPYADAMQPLSDACHARNSAWTFWLQLGENWHNNHHAAPGSASTWVEWHQIDFSYICIRFAEALGLVWGVRVEYPVEPRAGHHEISTRWEVSTVLLQLAIFGGWLVHRHLPLLQSKERRAGDDFLELAALMHDKEVVSKELLAKKARAA